MSQTHTCSPAPALWTLTLCLDRVPLQIEAEHGEISLAGQSEVVQDVNTHFVAFVYVRRVYGVCPIPTPTPTYTLPQRPCLPQTRLRACFSYLILFFAPPPFPS